MDTPAARNFFDFRKKYNNDDNKVLFLAVSDDNDWIKVVRQEVYKG